jgi:alkanesulfonate monooxygenase SsuD/methylene tetrahydromethanopterin reductase-like flavin-dependent oxidoreductase (luciferase family)
MRVGICLDLRNPPAWRQDPAHVYGFGLELCEEAEHLGAGSVWVTEHHLFDDGYLPQTLTYAAAIAARTKRVRIGTGILIAPLHASIEIAEQVAVVDLLSGGRVDLGLGAGYRVPEFELFGADIDRRYATTDDRARELRGIWAEGRVTPSPVQERLPIWMGYQGPKGARRAGRLGEPLLSARASQWEPYCEGLREGGHDESLGRMTGPIQGWVTDTPDEDWPTVSKYVAYQFDSYRRYMVEGTDQPIPRPVDPERLITRDTGKPLGTFLYGTPEEAAESIAGTTAGAPVETVFMFAAIGGMPDEMALRHVQTICSRLGPLLADL